MSSSNVTIALAVQNEINTINSFIILWARCFYPIIVVFGVVSNVLNIYVFTRPVLKRNPCCMYFLSSSFAALIYTVINLPLRTLQVGYNIDPTAYISAICKLKYFFVYTWRALTVWCIVLACIDRFLHSSSSATVREWSSFKIASRVIPLAFLLGHLAYVHVPIFHEIQLPRRTCGVGNNSYGIFLGIWHLLTYGTGPPLLMLIFSLLTIQHIHHRRIVPLLNQPRQENRNSNKDRNLIRMVFVQCAFVGLATTAYAIGQWYTTLTSNQVRDNLQMAKDNLFFHLVGSISAAGHSTTFFLFTLASPMFRQQLICRRRRIV